jgi:hypothetical protein
VQSPVLSNVSVRATMLGLVSIELIRGGREKDHHGSWESSPEIRKDRQATASGHRNVERDHVGMQRRSPCQKCIAALGETDDRIFRLQYLGDNLAPLRVVIGNENGTALHAAAPIGMASDLDASWFYFPALFRFRNRRALS